MENTVCLLSNEFHESENGCKLYFNQNNEHVHEFCGTSVTLSQNGTPMYKQLGGNFEKPYDVFFPRGDSYCSQILVRLPQTICPLEKYLQTGYDVVCLINIVSELTEKIQETSSTLCWFPAIKSLFDVVYDTTTPQPEIIFLRPVKFHLNLKVFLEEFQMSIINLFYITARNRQQSDKNVDKKIQLQLHPVGRNQKVCSLKYLIDSKEKLLECSDNSKKCIHEKTFENHKHEIYERSMMMPLCRKLWAKMIKNCNVYKNVPKREEKLENYLTFNCKHFTDCSFSQLLQDTFGRTTKIHTLFCFPSELLTIDWYFEVFKLIRPIIEKKVDNFMYYERIHDALRVDLFKIRRN